MIIGLYATLGVFLLMATRDPLASRSLIWFTVVSSIVHSAIMAVQALSDSNERGHLLGDVPALLIIAAVLAFLLRRAETSRTADVGSRVRNGLAVAGGPSVNATGDAVHWPADALADTGDVLS